MLHAGALVPGGLKRKVSWLPTRITSGCASVVPRKFTAGFVPLLPVSAHALPGINAENNAEGVNHDKFPLPSVCRSPVATVLVVVRLAGRV
jgi:hypothetical protein